MDHSLLIASLVVTELGHLLQGLTDSCDIPMTKDTKASREKGLLVSVTLYILVLEKRNQGLSHCHALSCLLIHTGPSH